VSALSFSFNSGAAAAATELTANMGFMSDYMVGGLYQSSSAAYTGVDFASQGFCAGARLADLDEGIEYDLYGAYSRSFDNGFTTGISTAGYFYSDEFDKTYRESGVSLDYKLASLQVVWGSWAGDLDPITAGTQPADYSFTSLKIGHSVFAKVGSFSGDFNGNFFSMGYSKAVGDLNLAVTLTLPDEDLDLHATANARAAALAEDPNRDVSHITDRDVYLTFDISYRFDL
jgi:uncharacterized protein (TIGR02001 family)